MGLDRPANPPDQSGRPDRPDHPAPQPAGTPADPWGVEHLTRAHAYESLRAKAPDLDAASERGTSDQPLTALDKSGSSSRQEPLDRPGDPPGKSSDRAASKADTDDPSGTSTLTQGKPSACLEAKAAEQDAAFGFTDGSDKTDGTSGDRSGPPQPPSSVDEPGRQRNYWTEVPRFLRLWIDHRQQWAASPESKAQWVLESGPAEEAADSIARIAETESVVSADVKEIESANTCDGRLEGFSFRLKGRERLNEKIASTHATSSPDATVAEIAQQIPDAIRYTFCFSPDKYTDGYYDIKERLEERGYHMFKCKNSWNDSEYKGVNTRWMTSQGQRFEVQFHTPESFHAKHEVTHEAYERIRNPLTPADERRDLSIFQREVSSWIRMPDRVFNIADYSEDGY